MIRDNHCSAFLRQEKQIRRGWGAGLPDFSWCNIPKRGKIYKKHEMYQMETIYSK
jgi:hypothetical protein